MVITDFDMLSVSVEQKISVFISRRSLTPTRPIGENFSSSAYVNGPTKLKYQWDFLTRLRISGQNREISAFLKLYPTAYNFNLSEWKSTRSRSQTFAILPEYYIFNLLFSRPSRTPLRDRTGDSTNGTVHSSSTPLRKPIASLSPLALCKRF